MPIKGRKSNLFLRNKSFIFYLIFTHSKNKKTSCKIHRGLSFLYEFYFNCDLIRLSASSKSAS